MEHFELEEQEAIAVDDETMALLQEALAQVERGETMTLEEATGLTRKQFQARRQIQKPTRAA